MEPILDQSRDLNGREAYRLDALYGTPEFVKNASLSDRCGDGSMKPHLYADQLHRLYPTHTAAATYTSAMFFFDKQASFAGPVSEEIERRLLAAADFRGIGAPVRALRDKIAQAGKEESAPLPDEDFAFIGVGRDGNKERRLPLRGKEETVKAAEWVVQYRHALDYRDRQKIASRVLEKARVHGVELGAHGETLERIAGLGICTAKTAAEVLRSRAKIARRSQAARIGEEFEKSADAILAHPHHTHSSEFMQGLAEVIDRFDRVTGIHRNYGGALLPPEDALFTVNIKTATAAVESAVAIDGKIFAKDDLAKITTKDARAYLGDEFAAQVDDGAFHIDPEKVAELVPSLTRPDRAAFGDMAAAAGIHPFGKQAGARAVRMNQAAMIALAMTATD